jgi:hypothetical protein
LRSSIPQRKVSFTTAGRYQWWLMSPMKMCFDSSYCYFTEWQYILNIKSTFKSRHEGHLVMVYYFH